VEALHTVVFLGVRIAKWWMPDDIVFVDELPTTASGKISKLALREWFRDHLVRDASKG